MTIDINNLKKLNYFKPAKNINSFEQKIGGSHFKCDYHVHSSFSHDGVTKPKALIKHAEINNIRYIAITYHNTLNFPIEKLEEFGGFPDSVFIKVGDKVKIIPAVEVTSRVLLKSGKYKTIHIGVYAPDLSNRNFMRYIKLKEENEKNIDYNYFIAVEKCLGCVFNRGAIKSYMNHLIQNEDGFRHFEKEHIFNFCKSVIEKGNYHLIENIDLNSKQLRKDFLDKVKYILDNTLRTGKFHVESQELIEKATLAGGITVLMHPNVTFDNQDELDEVRNMLYPLGLYGEEKIYADIATMNKLTQPAEKGVSGGTDSHVVYSKKLANVDGIELYADMFSITKKLEELEEQRAKNPNRTNKKIADVSYIKYQPRFVDHKTSEEIMKEYNISKKNEKFSEIDNEKTL